MEKFIDVVGGFFWVLFVFARAAATQPLRWLLRKVDGEK